VTLAGSILPGDRFLAESDVWYRDPDPETLMRRMLADLDMRYEYIVIDTPKDPGPLFDSALNWSDLVIIPLSADSRCIRSLGDTISAVEAARDRGNPELRVAGILAVKFNPALRFSREMLAQMKAIASSRDCLVFDAFIRECDKVRGAQWRHESLFDFAPRCTAARDYIRLAGELEQQLYPAPFEAECVEEGTLEEAQPEPALAGV